jgi:hypothetical protein
MSKPRKVERSITNNNNLPQSQARDDTTNYKYNSKKRSNKSICPFACPNCAALGEYVESRYNSLSILSDTGDSIFDPLHEKYHEEHKKSISNGGKVFLSADLVDSFFQKYKK